MDFKVIAVVLMVLTMLWELFLQYRNHKSLNNPVPECLKDIYNEAEYQKWHSYEGEKSQLHFYASVAVFAVNLVLILLDCYAGFSHLFGENLYAAALGVLVLDTLVSVLVSLPFEAKDTFGIEQKYGFNRSDKKTFIGDTVKNLIISLILMGVLVCAFTAIHQAMGDWVIVLFAGVFMLIVFCITLLQPVLTRVFNKFTPLEEGELKDKLTALLESHGYKVRAIEVMDASRRSTKMNAYFTGFGAMKTIVLYDTLVAAASPDELCAVFAHEMGHGLHHDTTKLQLINGLQAVLMALCLWVLVRSEAVFLSFGFSAVSYGMAFILMNIMMGVLSPLSGLLTSGFSRRMEYRADAQAVEEGYGEALISGLKLLSKDNMVNLSPDPLVVKLTYSHPTLFERVTAIEKKMKK